jgi:glutathione synthase/RimK-type ligase-like ATP-grasp enzyme
MSTVTRIAVIGRTFHPDGKETAELIAAALDPYMKEQGASVDFVNLKNLVFDIDSDRIRIFDAGTGTSLEEYGAILMTNWFSHASIRKDMAYTIALYLSNKHVPFFNSEALKSRSTSKLSQMMLAALHDVAIPRTVFSLSLEHLADYLRQIEFGAPFVLKDAQASRGKGNYLLKSIDEIGAHDDEHSERSPFIAQEFIDSDGSDFRFFVAGGKTKLVIHRMGSGDSHLNNTSAGATTELVEPEAFAGKTLDTVHAMCKILGRELTGIDIMFSQSTGRAYFLEANPIPQIATGSNTEEKLQALATALIESAQKENQA